MKPPVTLTMRWCPVCGRDDRFKPFTGKSHFTRGDRCLGKPVVLTYVHRLEAL